MDHLLKQGINSQDAYSKTSWNYPTIMSLHPVLPLFPSEKKKQTVLPPVSAPNKAGPAAPCWSEHRMTWWFKLTHLRSFHVEPPGFSTVEIGNPSFFSGDSMRRKLEEFFIKHGLQKTGRKISTHNGFLGTIDWFTHQVLDFCDPEVQCLLACLLASLLPCFLACLLACFLACFLACLLLLPKRRQVRISMYANIIEIIYIHFIDYVCPRCSMYGVFTYIWPKFMVNVGK